jgi:hypothetical protein
LECVASSCPPKFNAVNLRCPRLIQGKNFELYKFLLNIVNIKKYDNVMDENLIPKVKTKGSSFL